MTIFAMWLQETYQFTPHSAPLLLIFTALVAIAMAVQATVIVWLALRIHKSVTEMVAHTSELRNKLNPLIDHAQELTRKSHELLTEQTPKIRTITDNLSKTSARLAETSIVVHGSAQKFDTTITDFNRRAQNQVARVDGMVASALTSTTEVVEGIQNSIRTPVKKIVDTATQVRYALEGFMSKLRRKAAPEAEEDFYDEPIVPKPTPFAAPAESREEPYAATGTTGRPEAYRRAGMYTRYAESQPIEPTAPPKNDPYRR